METLSKQPLVDRLQSLPLPDGWGRWILLVLSLTFTLVSTYLFHHEISEKSHFRFRDIAVVVSHELDSRIRAYEDALYAARGLFDSSEDVTRENFHEFIQALSLTERYPGVANINYSVRLAGSQREAFEQRVQAETGPLTKGLPRFSIKPAGERPEYTILHYIEPMGPNVAAWGLDLTADPVWASAVEHARDTGQLAASTALTLIGDAKSRGASLLLRLALYQGKGVPGGVEDRRRLYTGIVGSAIRLGEMIETTLSRQTLARVRVILHENVARADDDKSAGLGRLLYDSQAQAGDSASAEYSGHTVTLPMKVGDRVWRLDILPLQNPVEILHRIAAAVLFVGSITASFLLFWLLRSLAIAHSRGVELNSRHRSALLLSQFGENLYSSLERREAYGVIARDLTRLLPTTAGALYVFRNAQSPTAAAVEWGVPLGIGEILTSNDCQALRRGHLHAVSDTGEAQICSHFTGTPPAGYACVPLSAQGELIGVLHVQRIPGASTNFPKEEIDLVKAAAQHTSLALANLGLRDKLEQQATRDNLTGLYNRHYLQSWFEQELHRAARHGRPVGAIMIDVDHFKRINDTFGHNAGDMVLKALGDLLKRSVRSSDVACRYGGEEFLLLMPEADLEHTLSKAEAVRRDVAALQLKFQDVAIGPITISLGAAVFLEAGALLRCADQALYAAKESGRNRTVVGSPAAAGHDLAAA